MAHSQSPPQDEGMTQSCRPAFFAQTIACWNWKCALMSATARSLVYLAAMAHTGQRGGLSVVAVEMIYVTVTAGLYAGLQQKALGFRSRLLGNLTIVCGVPMLAQILDWFTHRALGAAAPGKAVLAVCVFATVSALFHLHVMRRGAFLTGHTGCSLLEDLRRMPRLAAGFVLAPVTFLAALGARAASEAETEAAL
jgi:hypothetical protein